MRLKIPLGWSLALCCGAALAQAPTSQEIAAPDTDAEPEAITSIDENGVDIDATSEDYPQYAQAVRTALGPLYRKLRESAEPRDWMLASQLLSQSMSLTDIDPEFSFTRRAELLRNAAAAAPDDALVQWVAMTAMPGAGGGCAAPQTLPANLARCCGWNPTTVWPGCRCSVRPGSPRTRSRSTRCWRAWPQRRATTIIRSSTQSS